MIIYRMEHGITRDGMWYDHKGNYVPLIMTLTEGKSKHLPMDLDDRYGYNGRRWVSGCSDLDIFKHWFTLRDAKELVEKGCVLREFECTEYIVEEYQTLFTREGVISEREMTLDDVWNIKDEASMMAE